MTVPANHDCNACRFAGSQKYGEKVCALTGGACKKEAERAVETINLSPFGRTVLHIWSQSQSQWRIGMSGATGLDYSGVKVVADVLEIDFDERILLALQALEGAQLKQWSDEMKSKEK